MIGVMRRGYKNAQRRLIAYFQAPPLSDEVIAIRLHTAARRNGCEDVDLLGFFARRC